jgi:UDP-4-amino-4,6-dideoxy-N-acetyl-beta-L-altrosamine N-acetyltransferase
MPIAKRYPLSEFKPLTIDLLEQVWRWRNLPDIRRNMHSNDSISWQQHLKWFEKLQNDPQRRFFVFFQDCRPIGVLNFTYQNEGTMTWGCYLGETNVWPGSGLLLEIAALEYVANQANYHMLYAEVLSFNHNVIKMHQLFGYQQLEDKAGAMRDNQPYVVKVFCYQLEHWRRNREVIFAKLPKQITAAAKQILFY